MSAKQQPRAFGADDRPTCQHCGGLMHLIRRGPHSDFGVSYDKFFCVRNAISRLSGARISRDTRAIKTNLMDGF
jgi:hypothetical protein